MEVVETMLVSNESRSNDIGLADEDFHPPGHLMQTDTSTA
jgi:hypothetical protein